MYSTPLGGRYKFISQLGSGGFSRTFLVQDLHLPDHPRCVIKQLMPKTTNTASLEMARRLFDTEARALYQLGDHSQIPTLLAHFEENREFYLAQEFIEGVQLSRQLGVGKPWPEAWVIIQLREILEVLSFVHRQQVIHRDIKPSNLIRRRQDGRIVLIDFGAVKQVSTQSIDPDTGVTNLTIAIGTQGYMPNEQLAGKPRFSSDVYAVGMIGIRALTGVHPKRLNEDLRTSEIDWRTHAPQVSPELAAIIDGMVRYDFRDRYQTAIEALEALQSLPVDPEEFLPFPEALFNAQKAANSAVGKSLHGSMPPAPRNLNREPVTEFQLNSLPAIDSVPLSVSDAKTESTQSMHQSEFSQTLEKYGLATIVSNPFWKQCFKFFPTLGVFVALGVLAVLIKTVVFPQSTQRISNRVNTVANPQFSPDDFFEQLSPFISEGLARLPIEIPDLPPLKERIDNLLKRADRLQADGQYQAALDAYGEAIGLKPNLAEAYLGRCENLNALQQPDLAIVACEDALSFNPGYPEALRSMGNAFEQKEHWQEALKLYERATRIKPALAQAWLGRGRVLLYLGRSEEAIDALRRAISRNQNSADAWAMQAEAQWNLGHFDQAITSLDRALKLEPEHPVANTLRQQAREDLGR